MNTVQKIQKELDINNIKPSKMMSDLGFSSGLFSQWKSGKQKPSVAKLQKIAEYLNVSIEYLLDQPNTNIKSVDDIDIRRIERARNNMPQKEKDRMMAIIEAAFSEYFNDDFVDDDTDE